MVKDVGFIASTVEAITKLIQVPLQMFVAHTMISASDECFGVTDQDMHPRKHIVRFMRSHRISSMLKLLGKHRIGGIIVRPDFGLAPNGLMCVFR